VAVGRRRARAGAVGRGAGAPPRGSVTSALLGPALVTAWLAAAAGPLAAAAGPLAAAGRCRAACGEAGEERVPQQTQRRYERQPQHRSPVPPPPRRPARRKQLVQAHRRQHARRTVDRVILADQRLGVGADGLGDATDIPPGVKVTTTCRVVLALDPRDDRFPDAGPLADLSDGQASPPARFRQRFSDPHAAPPLPPPSCTPPPCGVQAVMTASLPLCPPPNYPKAGLG
jgi:hypothetical protein